MTSRWQRFRDKSRRATAEKYQFTPDVCPHANKRYIRTLEDLPGGNEDVYHCNDCGITLYEYNLG